MVYNIHPTFFSRYLLITIPANKTDTIPEHKSISATTKANIPKIPI